MPRSDKFSADRITRIRFQVDASVDHVTARLLESVRRTDLSLLTVTGDDHGVYPFGARNAIQAASSWRAELLWREGATDDWHLEVFLRRADLFLDCPDGVQVESTVPRRKASSRKARNRGAYGLDGAFGDDRLFVLPRPSES